MLHGQRCLQGSSVVQDWGRRYPSCVGAVKPLSRGHREVGRGRGAVGSVGGTRSLLARERECVERLDEVLRTFVVCFVLPACHDGG